MKWTFASCVLQEIWLLEGNGLSLKSRNSDAGYTVREDPAGELARSTDAGTLLGSSMPSAEAFVELVRRSSGMNTTLRIRWVHETHFVADGDVASTREYSVLSTSNGWAVSAMADMSSIASTAQFLAEAVRQTPVRLADYETLPLLWARGTAGVLLHEAVGHPAERGIGASHFPEWLAVVDDPARDGLGKLARDDAGSPTRLSNLLVSTPASVRRASYREPALPRLSNVVCTSLSHDGLVLPESFIEIKAVGGGAYDELTDRVSLEVVSADLVDGAARLSLVPFRYEASRKAVGASIVAAGRESLRYPGVLCSDEGQTIPVGTFAPELLTRPLR